MLTIDPKNIESAKEILRTGTSTEFWRLICNALDDSIAHLQAEQDGDDIKDLPSEQYKVEAELLKAKRKYLVHLKGLPNTLIQYLTEPPDNTEKQKNFDPYYTASELGEALSKNEEKNI